MISKAKNPARIEDYAMIGDLGSAALVSREGSIDWLCWPRFDSDACFSALLGTPEHGRWLIGPKDKATKITRRYRPNTLILETRFETEEGAATLIDFMPPREKNSHLLRMLVGEWGRMDLHGELILRFGYGASVPWVTRIGDNMVRAVSGPDMAILRSSAPFRGEGYKTVGDFSISAGETQSFSLSYALSHEDIPEPVDVAAQLIATEKYWCEWSGRNKISGPYDEAVVRSLITLKALTYAPTGGMVAAPTTSLPESFGGVRNWDYRFCWLRDATLTLLALMNGGYYDEAQMWRDWLLRAAAGSPRQIQIMYGIGGERRLTEWEIPWLPGYADSKPVRIGNAAHNQLQLDIFGEVMDALHQARKAGLGHHTFGWDLERALLDHLETIWRQPDEGIWEIRGARQHFTYSKVMAWVAFDRAIKSAELHKLEGPVAHWRSVRKRIHDDVCEHGFNAELGHFVQSYGGKELDASLLLLPALGFLPPEDKRVHSTIEAIERELTVDGLVLRYDSGKTDDGLPKGEGLFLACSFWLADALLMIGRSDDARRLFERLLTLRNDLGLLSEEYEPRTRQLAGNFPQAFSHLALVNTASNLSHYDKPAEQRSEHPVTEEPVMRETAS